MTHHTIPGSQIDPSQALPSKTYAQHQESNDVENHKGCVGGIPVPGQEPTTGGNGRSVVEQSVVKPNIVAEVLMLFSECGFDVRPAAGEVAVTGSIDAAGMLVETFLEAFAQGPTDIERRKELQAAPLPSTAGAAKGGATSDNIESFRAATTQATPAGWRIEKDEDAAHGKRIRVANPSEGFATLRADGDDPRETVLFRYFDQMAATTQASTAQAERAPEGWKLVPIKPTDEMARAGYYALPEPAQDVNAEICWDAMLAAAPVTTTSSTDAQAAAEVRDAAQKEDADVLNTLLWLYRRLPRGYGRLPFIDASIYTMASRTGVEVGEMLDERALRAGDTGEQADGGATDQEGA